MLGLSLFTAFFLFIPVASAQTIVRSFQDSVLLEGHSGGVFAVDINKTNEAIVASASDDNSIIVWDWTTRQKVFKKQLGEKASKVSFSNLGKALAFSGDYRVMVLSTSDWTTLYEFKVPLDRRYKQSGYLSASCMRFSPDDRLLAVGFKTEIVVWDMSNGEVVGRYDEGGTENWDCMNLEFNSDGTRLMGLMQNQFHAWHISDARPTGTPPFSQIGYVWLPFSRGDAIAISKDFQYVAFNGESKILIQKNTRKRSK